MHASGIRVDDQAKADFLEASNDASCLYLKYGIRGETFVRTGRGSTADSLQANFAEIARGLAESPDAPAFVVSKHVSSEPNKWLLIFYMPEGSIVRDRMVYAASAAALKDGLGQSNFDAQTFSLSKVSECTAAEYESVSRTMSHEELLTMDEKDKLESESESQKAMSSTRARAIVGLPIQASEESVEAISAVQKGQPSTVILQLNAETEMLQVQQQGTFTFEQIQSKLPPSEPRYVLQHFSHEHDGAQVSSFIFLYYCPDDIKPKLKMFYSTCKQVVVKLCENLGVVLSKSIELSETKEITTAAVLEELYPQVAVKKTFKKPARPGRGNARLISSPDNATSPSPSPQ